MNFRVRMFMKSAVNNLKSSRQILAFYLFTCSVEIHSARLAGGESIRPVLFHVVHKIFGRQKNSEGIFQR